jgi:hypothetical protein
MIINKYLGDISKSLTAAVQRKKVTLTSAQILALNTTPIALIPAPGAGKYISVDEVVCLLNFNTTQYTGANALEFRYTDGSGVKVTGDIAAALINAAANRADKAIGAAVAVAVANAAIVAVVPTANPAAGDSTIVVDIKYRICDLP